MMNRNKNTESGEYPLDTPYVFQEHIGYQATMYCAKYYKFAYAKNAWRDK